MRRLLRTSLVLIVALEVLYLVAANGAGVLAPRFANRQPDRTHLSFRAFTPFPGLVFVWDFQLRAQDRFTQWQLDIDRATVWVDLSSLRERTFHARKVDADGVAFKLRRKLQLPEVRPDTLEAQPQIEGFGEVALRQDEDFLMPPPRPGRWTIKMEGVDARGTELWVDTLRYDGPLAARGAWWLQLEQNAEIVPGEVQLGGGRLVHGEQELARTLVGTIRADLHEFPTRQLTPAMVFERIDGSVQLVGALADPAALMPLLKISPKLQPTWSGGTFAINAELVKGVAQPESRISANVHGARVQVGGLRVAGSAKVDARVANDRGLHVNVAARRLDVRRPGSKPLADGGTVHVGAVLRGGRVDEYRAPRHVALRLEDALLSDARALNELLPAPLQLAVQSGIVRANGKLKVDLQRGLASGHAQVRGRQLAIEHRGQGYEGRLDARIQLARLDPEARSFRIDGTHVKLSDVRARDGRRVLPWSAQVAVSRGSVDLGRKEVFRGNVHSSLSHARPLFGALLENTKVPRIARKLLTPNHVTAKAEVGLGRRWVRLDGLRARVGRTQVRATARLNGTSTQIASELALGSLRAGIQQVGNHRKLRLFPAATWYPGTASTLAAAR